MLVDSFFRIYDLVVGIYDLVLVELGTILVLLLSFQVLNKIHATSSCCQAVSRLLSCRLGAHMCNI